MGKINEKAIDLWFQDLQSLEMIGVFFGVSRQAVKKWLNRRGIDTSKQKWDIVCDECGIGFKKHRCQIRKNRKNYCSTGCYYKALYNPDYNQNRQGQIKARSAVKEFFGLSEDNIVHHINSNTEDNDPGNLMVFANHSDHMRWHRAGFEESGVIPLWRGDGGPVEKKVIKMVEDLEGSGPFVCDLTHSKFFKPMSKTQQLGKKGK